MPDAATDTNTNTNAGAAGDSQPWWGGYDDETKGYVQNKGLATKPIAEAFAAVSKFHREAEKMIGAPANELLRLPKEPNAPEWNQVYKRLGALDKPDDYKFDGVKHAGDKPLNEGLVATLRKAAHSAHLAPDAAQGFAKEIVQHLDKVESEKVLEATASVEKEKKALKDNWGTNEAANMVIARAAALALNVTPEAVSALEKQVGYSKVMEMFRLIGTKIGEDRFVNPGSPGGNGNVMTKEQAIAEKNALKNDNAWVNRYLSGGLEEKRKMEALDRLISGVTA